MRFLMLPAVLVLAFASTSGAPPPDKSTMVPQLVDIEGCILPAAGCEAEPLSVLELTVGDETLRLAVRELRSVGGTQGGERLLADLRGHRVRVMAPDDLAARLTSGSHLRLRAALRSGTHVLFLQDVTDLAAD